MNLNFLKGMLIILVVVDHNEFTRGLFRDFFLGLSFHVIGFMAIPFLKPALAWHSADAGAYAARLFYPFFIVTCSLWTVVSLLGNDAWLDRMGLLGLALYSGNAEVLKAATQMGLLWFLPSFISIVFIRAFIEGAGTLRKWLSMTIFLKVSALLFVFYNLNCLVSSYLF